MLEQVRRKMKSGSTYVLVAFLTVIFMFFFGVPTQDCASGGPAGRQANATLASVAGEAVESKDVNAIYNRVFTDTSSDDDKYQQRRATSLRNLLLIELFAQRARDAGLRVSQKELQEYIQDASRNVEFRYMYGNEGSFNGHYYKAYVQNRLRMSLQEYEQFKREELLARNYLAMQASQLAVPTTEIGTAHELANTKMNLSFVGLSADKLQESVQVSEQDISDFLANNSDRVKTYYDKHKEEKYSEPAELKVRRVYIPRPSDSAKAANAKNRWKEAQTRVFDKGESVGTVAAELGESIPGQEKGMMGWSTTDNMSKEIVGALEGQDVGTKKRVETKGAYMIVKLEDRKTAKTTALDKVETDIARNLIRQDQVDALVEEVTDKLHEKAAETGSLEKALTALKKESDKPVWNDLSVQETGEFTLESQSPPPGLAGRMGGRMPNIGGSWSKIPKIGDSKELAVDTYKTLSEKNPVPDTIYTVGSTKYIVRLKSKNTPEEEASAELSAKLSNKKVSEVLGPWSAIFGSVQGRFVPPMNEYGPWIDRQLKQAVDDGTVELYPKTSQIAQIVHQSFQPGGDSSGGPKAGKKGKGGPIQIGGNKGKGKGGSKTIKIGGGKGKKSKKQMMKQLKKKLKNKKMKMKMKKKGGGQKGGSEGTGSESGGSPSGESGGTEPTESGGGE